jgi:hypothetical protein
VNRVIFSPQRGVVVGLPMGVPIDLPLGSRNFLNASEPGPSMKNLEADIMTRQYGQMTLTRDQKRQIDRSPHEPSIHFIRADFATVPIQNEPFVGVVELP